MLQQFFLNLTIQRNWKWLVMLRCYNTIKLLIVSLLECLKSPKIDKFEIVHSGLLLEKKLVEKLNFSQKGLTDGFVIQPTEQS